ncbi:MAG: stage II sporulation protein P [Clostridia bacterium]|nr:stage II sporulation protein P [Clostridia bacterium]
MDKLTEFPVRSPEPAPPASVSPGVSEPPADHTALSGYTLFPDAGDFAGLDEIPPLPEPAEKPPVSLPEPPPAIPSRRIPEQQPAPVRVSKPVSVSPFRHLLRFFYAVCILLALAVYGNMLLSGAASLVSEGVGKLAANGVFGSFQSVTVLPQPAESQPPDRTEAPAADTAIQTTVPETAPPANEESVTAPAVHTENRDLSSSSPNGLGLISETPYTPDLAALAAMQPVIDSYASLESVYGKNCPAVLILHTHGTEAFQDQAASGYHTTDPSANICAVGKALAETLTEAGIGVIRCTELFDAESFDMAYYNAARYIRQTLEDHPSIRYILDIHRDAITAGDGTGIRPLSVLDDTEYAQLMFVVGTDHGGSGHTEWETNLALAARLQTALHTENPTLMRDINLRSASFNAQYAPGALLVEAGSACSTLEEAIRSIQVFGEALAKEILGE